MPEPLPPAPAVCTRTVRATEGRGHHEASPRASSGTEVCTAPARSPGSATPFAGRPCLRARDDPRLRGTPPVRRTDAVCVWRTRPPPPPPRGGTPPVGLAFATPGTQERGALCQGTHRAAARERSPADKPVACPPPPTTPPAPHWMPQRQGSIRMAVHQSRRGATPPPPLDPIPPPHSRPK